MQKTLGQQIGRVSHKLSIKNNRDEKVTIGLVFDFTTATDTDIKAWCVSNRTISFQRPARAMSADEIQALDGSVIIAQDAGKKVVSREERIDAMAAQLGVSREIATYAVDNPDALEKFYTQVKNQGTENEDE